MRRKLTLVPLAAAALVAGCGGSTTPRTPPESARLTVLQFLAAVRDDHPAAACALATDAAKRQLHDSALSELTVKPGSLANRTQQVHVLQARARTCAGAVALLGEENRSSLARTTAKVRTQPLSWLGPPGDTATMGDEDWDVVHHDGRWQVDNVNAL